ncbi:MAG: hypothetical protein WCS84_07710 [Nocardioides sp.]
MKIRKTNRIRARIAITGGIMLFVFSACGAESGTEKPATEGASAESKNCGPYTDKIVESAEFTPYASQRSHLPESYLNPDGVEAQDVPEGAAVPRIDGLARQFSLVDPDGGSYQYFSGSPIDSKTTVAAFQASGGIALEATPAKNAGLPEVVNQVGDKRAIPVEVGPYPGVVIWADPEDASERRMHHVYWEADGYLFGLILQGTPEHAATVSREVACASLTP